MYFYCFYINTIGETLVRGNTNQPSKSSLETGTHEVVPSIMTGYTYLMYQYTEAGGRRRDDRAITKHKAWRPDRNQSGQIKYVGGERSHPRAYGCLLLLCLYFIT